MFSELLNKKNTSVTFFCFSPAVMLTTLAVEFSLVLYSLIRFRMTRFGQLAAITLFLLGAFQVAEYQICSGNSPVFWARLGYIAITLLPAIGIHLISLITGNARYVQFSYTLAAMYVFIFLFSAKSIVGAACSGNYVIFDTIQELYWTYGIYYTGLLILGAWELADKIRSVNPREFSLRVWMAFGYFSFMVPMTIAYMLLPDARNAVPSIMCGFAVIFALLLAFIITPKYYNK